jgi:hypothetical protein
MSNSSILATVNSVFNLISFGIDAVAILICMIYLCAISYRFIEMKCNRRRLAVDVPLLLSINIICIILIKSILQMIHVTIPTLMKDFQLMSEFNETFFYRFRAYILWSMISVLYWSYGLLAFFRFVRVIYPTKLWLHQLFLYLYILIPIEFIFVFLSMLPLLVIFDSLHQIPDEAYCSISCTPFYPLLYSTIVSFFVPYNIMCVFYMCITRKMRQSSVRLEQVLHRRDYIVLRRILLNMVILSIVAAPYLVLYILGAIENYFGLIIYRIQWLSSSAASGLFSSMLLVITTQLREFLRPNRLAPVNN